MPIILKINNDTAPITVDSTVVTVDSTSITADRTYVMTGTGTTEYSVLVTPREMVDTVSMEFYDELKDVTTTFTASTIDENRLMRINFDLNGVQEGSSYEVKIKKLDGSILWTGKAYATSQDDLQNFQFIKKTNNNIIKL